MTMRESMHRPISSRDLRRDDEERRREEAAQTYDDKRQQVIDAVLGYDKHEKALTGRRVEQYEEEAGLLESELFPEGGHVLNIGDPWQVMDKEGVVNLEYETGEEADFLHESGWFLEGFEDEMDRVLSDVERIANNDPELGKELRWRLLGVREFAQSMTTDEYPKQARVLYDALRLLGESHRDETNEAKRELWYAFMRLARGLEDIFYTKTVIEPALEEADRRADMTPEKRSGLISSLVADVRGGKKYKQAELVKGAFPLTDFDDASFDRIVASWSLSVHMFSAMENSHFETTFQEIGRLLKPEGAAYLWPLHFRFINDAGLWHGLVSHREHGGTAGIVVGWGKESDVVWMDEEPDQFAGYLRNAHTLIVLAPGAKAREEAKNRIDEAIIREDPWVIGDDLETAAA